jgi:hypothetical protein
MLKRYFVSYYIQTDETTSYRIGYGNCWIEDIVKDKPNFNQIREWEKQLKKSEQTEIKILNFIEIDRA